MTIISYSHNFIFIRIKKMQALVLKVHLKIFCQKLINHHADYIFKFGFYKKIIN